MNRINLRPVATDEAAGTLHDLSDEQLMLRYQSGDAAAFDVLYARHKGTLYRYFIRQLSAHPDRANELFQEVWMSLIRTLDQYQPSAKFTTYIFHIAHNKLVDHWRRNKPDTPLEAADPVDDTNVGPDEQVQRRQLEQQLRQQIAGLPEEQRNTFLLKEEGSFSLQQIADITGVNRETVKSRLRYAINRLKQGLAVHHE